MSVKLISGTEVQRPTPDALSSSIMDHATVVENPHFGLRNNEGMWDSYNSLPSLNLITVCPDPFSGYKVFDSAEWVDAFAFALYGGTQCQAVGLDKADQKTQTERLFNLNEGKGVESALLAERLIDGEDITPAAPIPLIVALGLLEGHAAKVYAGVPTIHMPRAAIVILMGAGAIVETGGKFFTKTGSKVVAGGGYDVGLEDGEWEMYATGEVYIERRQVEPLQQMVRPGDGSGLGSDENQLEENTVVTLVERMYRVALDGFVAKVTATVW